MQASKDTMARLVAQNPRELIMRLDIRRIVLTALATVAFSVSAVAGLRSAADVVISDTYGWAYGDKGHVRNSADRTQLIGCQIFGSAGTCYARDVNNVLRQCYTTEARWLRTIASVKSDSYVRFDWDASGRCAFVAVQNDSLTDKK